MSQALALSSRPLALELHAVLRALDPARFNGADGPIRRRIACVEAGLSRVLSTGQREPPAEGSGLLPRLGEIAGLLRHEVPRAELPAGERRAAWDRFRRRLGQAYEALSVALSSWSIHLPSLRPTNHTRSIFHAIMGMTCVVLIEEVLSGSALWIAPLVFAATFWFLEGLRHHNARARAALLRFFRAIAHPHERFRINSSTWYATALVILGLSFAPLECAVACAVLGFADPAAAFVGRRHGRHPLVHGRTLEGSLTFALVGALAAFAVMAVWHRELPTVVALAIALGVALPAAVAELLSRRVDDNFSVPLVAAAGAWTTLALVGVG